MLESHNDETNKYTGQNEVINGIEIQTHSMMSPLGKQKKSAITGKDEETKVNFFNPMEHI